MFNLSRYDRRYAALWLPLAGVLLAGFILMALVVIGILLMAGLGLARGTLAPWLPAGLPQLFVSLAFAPLMALLIGLLAVGGALLVVIRIIAFDSRRPRRAALRRGSTPYHRREAWARPVDAAMGLSRAAGEAPDEPRGGSGYE